MSELQLKSIRERIKTQINDIVNIASNGTKPTEVTEYIEIKESVQTFTMEGGLYKNVKILYRFMIQEDVEIVAIKFQNGSCVNPHKHTMYERKYVLSGSYYDDVSKETFGEGEVQITVPGALHSMKSDDCIVLIFRSKTPF